MIKVYVDAVQEAYDELKEKYNDTALAVNLLNIAMSARNADCMNTKVELHATYDEGTSCSERSVEKV